MKARERTHTMLSETGGALNTDLNLNADLGSAL